MNQNRRWRAAMTSVLGGDQRNKRTDPKNISRSKTMVVLSKDRNSISRSPPAYRNTNKNNNLNNNNNNFFLT
eukprot:UN16731